MSETTSTPLVHQVEVGPAENFIYFVGDPETKSMAIVDPAWDVPFILQEAERLGYAITAIWLTHGHHDHTNGVAELLENHPVPVYISRHEAPHLRPEVDLVELEDDDTVALGPLAFRVIHTPGHSPGGQCFLHGRHLIAGDTLFIDGCGRCDLADSDVEAMYHSIHHKLMTLPDDTIIYPGHNYGPTPTDTLGHQKKTNRFMLAKTKAEFIRERTG
jgi:glyoxylase-like metal-dependent hydrolase (beta-lactamase superfamily II)